MKTKVTKEIIPMNLQEFKKQVCIGYCILVAKDKFSKTTFETWQTKKGRIIIEIGDNGNWYVYKSCPFIQMDKTINWVNE